MVINTELEAEAWEHFRQHAGEFDCVISSSVEEREAKLFLALHPNAQVQTRTLGNATYVVLLI
jgi:hypothetical protein